MARKQKLSPAVKAYLRKITSAGGKARARKLTATGTERARKAVLARWAKEKAKREAR